MLVLTRRCGEELVIGGNIHVTVLSVERGQVRLGITAPRSVTVDRQEVHERRTAFVESDEVDATGGHDERDTPCQPGDLAAQNLHA